jgi:anti-sigma B factor antagonist
MELTVEVPRQGVTIVKASGRLDILSAGDAKQKFADVVSAGQNRLVVDLSQVASMDSSGLSALISGLKAARLVGGDLRIACPSQPVRIVLELTRLDRVLHPYATPEEALADYK